MKVLWILVLSIISVWAQDIPFPTDLDSCTFCEFATKNIESLIAANAQKNDVLALLGVAKKNICPVAESANLLKIDECEKYVDLYGPYALDMFLSDEITSPASICSGLGLCQASSSDISPKVLFPVFNEKSVDFQKVESSVSTGSFTYKIFVAQPSFEYKFLKLKFDLAVKDCSAVIQVTNKDQTIQQNDVCDENEPCKIRVRYIVPGTWYYITITPTSSDSEAPKSDGSFILTIKEKECGNHWPGHHVMKKNCTYLIVGLSIGTILLCCCCCCCIRRMKRRTCRGRRACRWSQKSCEQKPQPQQQTQPQEFGMVPLESVESGEVVDPMPIPMVVYYSANVPFPYGQYGQPVQYGQQFPYIPLEKSPQ